MPFDPFRACIQPYPITSFQPTYFLAESFKDAKEKLRWVRREEEKQQWIEFLLTISQYVMTIPRPFAVHYNPYTQTIEVVDGQDQIVNILRGVRSESIVDGIRRICDRCWTTFLDDMDTVLDALRKSEVPVTIVS